MHFRVKNALFTYDVCRFVNRDRFCLGSALNAKFKYKFPFDNVLYILNELLDTIDVHGNALNNLCCSTASTNLNNGKIQLGKGEMI